MAKCVLMSREMQIKATMIYYFMSVRMAAIKRTKYLAGPGNVYMSSIMQTM